MAFKIKDNLDLYGNQLLNFALQSDSGFPQSPQVGHIFNYTGTGVMANHAVMCVDETTKAFKALAFVDEIATNAEFVELKEKVDLLIGDDVDTDTIIDSWKEVQAFLAGIEDTKTLAGMLSSYLPLSGGTIRGSVIISGNDDTNVPLNIATPSMGNTGYIRFGAAFATNELGHLGFSAKGVPAMMYEGTEHTLLHSGNIGSYALKTDGSNAMEAGILWSDYSGFDETSMGLRTFMSHNGTSVDGIFPSTNYGTVLHVSINSSSYAFQLASSVNADGLFYRGYYSNNKSWESWKTIAFTDSTVDNAKILVDANNAYMVYQTNAGHLYVGDNIYTRGDTHILGKNIRMRYGENASYGLILNSYGNVLIGTTTDNGAKLQIYSSSSTTTPLFTIEKGGAYDARFELNNTVDKFRFIQQSSGNAYISLNGNHSIVFETSNTARMCITGGGNVGIGTPDPQYELDVNGGVRANGVYVAKDYGLFLAAGNEGIYLSNNSLSWHNTSNAWDSSLMNFAKNDITLYKKTTIKGDLLVEGNIIATGEVSAGGAGQEGESGDGGAEVIDKELAKGQSSYTIPNTIGRSAVAVSLYEWNANNSSWDMCLADISVKDATITVTFGSATSVNHKLVAVG